MGEINNLSVDVGIDNSLNCVRIVSGSISGSTKVCGQKELKFDQTEIQFKRYLKHPTPY
jgi:hypothetical protein